MQGLYHQPEYTHVVIVIVVRGRLNCRTQTLNPKYVA